KTEGAKEMTQPFAPSGFPCLAPLRESPVNPAARSDRAFLTHPAPHSQEFFFAGVGVGAGATSNLTLLRTTSQAGSDRLMSLSEPTIANCTKRVPIKRQ